MVERLKPGEMRRGKRNAETGVTWVQVSREAAHAHPMGKLNWLMVMIILYFLAVGVLKFWQVLGFGGGIGVALMGAALPLVTGLLLWAKAAMARVLVIVTGILTLLFTVAGGFGLRGMDTAQMVGGEFWAFISLGELIAVLAITIYMWEGDRPNLIYANRFRSFRDPDEGATDG
ncbi:hypothetical protein [Rhodalgimonas zhirmunskyi]|uniref:Uncharacterized protein n=1 Tax=Rhodalgimonas zhirmunskyi TaxID=2964767 RepID=A0AAJ1X6N5_9RHOB|nr:hypothetical protein [Rhodoalgimonas zhirmunskyi]MDQ2095389.1 hypothetical protein [Rhodoalgimonas zhirmunskyi]